MTGQSLLAAGIIRSFRRLAHSSRETAHHFVRRHDVGEHCEHDAERRVVLFIIVGRRSVRDEDHLIIHHHRIPGGRLAAYVRRRTGDDNRINAALLQNAVQWG